MYREGNILTKMTSSFVSLSAQTVECFSAGCLKCNIGTVQYNLIMQVLLLGKMEVVLMGSVNRLQGCTLIITEASWGIAVVALLMAFLICQKLQRSLICITVCFFLCIHCEGEYH